MHNINTLINLIKSLRITEKTFKLLKKNYYTFIVGKSFTKNKIKYLFEICFNQEIKALNILPLKNFKNYKKLYIRFSHQLPGLYFPI
jgi:ribosomal protein L23